MNKRKLENFQNVNHHIQQKNIDEQKQDNVNIELFDIFPNEIKKHIYSYLKFSDLKSIIRIKYFYFDLFAPLVNGGKLILRIDMKNFFVIIDKFRDENFNFLYQRVQRTDGTMIVKYLNQSLFYLAENLILNGSKKQWKLEKAFAADLEKMGIQKSSNDFFDNHYLQSSTDNINHLPFNAMFPTSGSFSKLFNETCKYFEYSPISFCGCYNCYHQLLELERFRMHSMIKDDDKKIEIYHQRNEIFWKNQTFFQFNGPYDPITMIDSNFLMNLQEIKIFNFYYYDRILFALGKQHRPLKKVTIEYLHENFLSSEYYLMEKFYDPFQQTEFDSENINLLLLNWSLIQFPECIELEISGNYFFDFLKKLYFAKNMYFQKETISFLSLFPNLQKLKLFFNHNTYLVDNSYWGPLLQLFHFEKLTSLDIDFNEIGEFEFDLYSKLIRFNNNHLTCLRLTHSVRNLVDVQLSCNIDFINLKILELSSFAGDFKTLFSTCPQIQYLTIRRSIKLLISELNLIPKTMIEFHVRTSVLGIEQDFIIDYTDPIVHILDLNKYCFKFFWIGYEIFSDVQGRRIYEPANFLKFINCKINDKEKYYIEFEKKKYDYHTNSISVNLKRTGYFMY